MEYGDLTCSRYNARVAEKNSTARIQFYIFRFEVGYGRPCWGWGVDLQVDIDEVHDENEDNAGVNRGFGLSVDVTTSGSVHI